MMTIERVSTIPVEMLPYLSAIGKEELQRSWSMLQDIIAMSDELHYVREGDRPLLLIGGTKMSLLDTQIEAWMYGTTFLRARHLREARKLFHDWCTNYPGKVVARGIGKERCRFIQLFGFRFVAEDEFGVKTYEVKTC